MKLKGSKPLCCLTVAGIDFCRFLVAGVALIIALSGSSTTKTWCLQRYLATVTRVLSTVNCFWLACGANRITVFRLSGAYAQNLFSKLLRQHRTPSHGTVKLLWRRNLCDRSSNLEHVTFINLWWLKDYASYIYYVRVGLLLFSTPCTTCKCDWVNVHLLVYFYTVKTVIHL